MNRSALPKVFQAGSHPPPSRRGPEGLRPELLRDLDLVLQFEAPVVDPELAPSHVNSHAPTVVSGLPRSAAIGDGQVAEAATR